MSGISKSKNKFFSGLFRIKKTGAPSILVDFILTALTASRSITLPDKSGTLAMTSDIAAAAEIPDNTFRITDNGDSTKKFALEVSNVDAATTRTLTVPNRDLQLGSLSAWVTATKYLIGDVVVNSYLGSLRIYKCNTAHTAGTFATDVATKWDFLGAVNFETALFALLQTADPTKKLTFDLSLLTASRAVTVPDKAGTMAMLSDITTSTLTDTQFLYRQALRNSNHDLWTRNGTSFTNPATGLELSHNWFIRKANGGGTAPSVNISRDTTIPNKLSKYSMKLDVTATGTNNATMQYEIYQSIFDYERFQGKNISMSVQILAPTASETIELIIDDGVTTTLHSAKTVTNSWAVYKYENISISASATKLEFIFRLAGGTSLSIPAAANFKPSTTGAFYFTQCQLNEGTQAIDYKPKAIHQEAQSCFASGTVTVTSGGGDVTVNLPFDWTGGVLELFTSQTAAYYNSSGGGVTQARMTTTYDALTNTNYTNNEVEYAGDGDTHGFVNQTASAMANPVSATSTSFTLKNSAGTTTYVKWFVRA